jgi:drug/metabolite transporter (DMT)-like permease
MRGDGRDVSGGSGAALAVIAGAALLGLSPLAVRLSELGPQATSFWRFALSLPILLLWALRTGPKPSRRQVWLLILAGAFFGLDVALWSAALGHTSVANATLLTNMTPVFAAGFGWLVFRERLSAAVLTGGGVALAGAVVLALARAHSDTGPAQSGAEGWLGDGLGLASAVWYAGYLLIVRGLRGSVGLGAVMFWAGVGGLALTLCTTLIMGETLMPQTLRGWAILIALALVVQIGGQGLIAYGVGRLQIAFSTVLLWVQPLAAAALSWVFFDERLGAMAFVGAALILGGVWLVQRARGAAEKIA